MELFLVRHGQTDANAKGIIMGWSNVPLNEAGLDQAKEAAKLFDEQVDAIYSSDLKRAVQTATEFCRKFPNLPYFEDERLRERNFGDAAGKPKDYYDWEAFWASPPDEALIPNAETLDHYNARVLSFIDDLKKSGYLSVLIVAHGGTISRFRELVLGEGYTEHEHGSVVHITLDVQQS